jgi:bifunctional non-homologous end joining protein LigD
MSSDVPRGPRQLLDTLRPQEFATSPPGKVVDPIIEPLWVGVRALAAIDDLGATLVDDQADPITGIDPILAALADAARAGALVVDGFLTKQAQRTSAPVYRWSDERPSMTSLVGLRRNRAIDAVTLREDNLAARTLDPDEELSFVATDLLWLDDTSLLDIPLLERRRLLDSVLSESELVRVGVYVRPPIETWLGSWRAQGFTGLTYKAANSRYRPGETSPDWVVGSMPRR